MHLVAVLPVYFCWNALGGGCALVAAGWRMADLHGGEWSVGFQRKLLPYGRAALFFHLNKQVVFQGAFPGSDVEGKGDHVQLKFFYFCIGVYFILYYFSFIVSKLCVCARVAATRRLRVRSEENCTQTVSCFFLPFFFFFWLEPLFPYAWIRGDEIGRVSRRWVSSRPLGLVVYVVPGLCRRRRESPIPQQHNKERHTGATSCPQAAREAKLCQVAAHPAADAKHPSLFSTDFKLDYNRKARHGPRDPVQRMRREFWNMNSFL